MKETIHYIIAGRFQPFHNGHLSMIEYVAEYTNGPIVVGIVNPDPTTLWPGDGDWIRFLPKYNPLNFWERYTSIRLGTEKSRFANKIQAIIPLPRPSVNLERANQFLPSKPRCFVVFERRGDVIARWKRDAYTMNGEEAILFSGNVLPREAQIAEGAVIRDLIGLGNNAWEEFLPQATAKYLRKINIQEKILKLGFNEMVARRNVYQFCIENGLEELANDVVDNLEELNDELSVLLENKSGRNRAIYERLLTKLNTPSKEYESEIVVLLENEEYSYMEAIVAEMFRSQKIKTVPRFINITGGLHQAEMTSITKEEITKHIQEILR